jgi:hypothetical protein
MPHQRIVPILPIERSSPSNATNPVFIYSKSGGKFFEIDRIESPWELCDAARVR